ncbi:MAG TPA: hypothetical protein VK845_07595, partial [Gemmatimonadales bacterium]|nr:hypothetical protein [Gemmatimonadales bacterium]
MTHLRLGRWVATVGLALGVASLGACASDSTTLTDPTRPSFGGTPSDPTGDRTVGFELFELCKDYSGQAGPAVIFDVTVDRDNDNSGADVSFQVTLADGECQEIWTDGGTSQDLVTVTEQVPVPATGSYAPSFVKTKLVRTSGVDNVVVDAPVAGNSTSEAFSGDTPSGVVGVLVEFTNTFVPPPDPGCTYTQGYWKTHSVYGPAGPADGTWDLLASGPDTPFFLSGQTWYEVFWTSPSGNAYSSWAHQYRAAKLNVLNGADPTDAASAIASAETL